MLKREDPDKTFAERVLIVIGLVVLTLLVLVLIYFTFDVLLLIFAAVLLSIFLRGLGDVLGYVVKISEGWRVMIVAVFLLVTAAAAIVLLAPNVGSEIDHLRTDLPRSARAAADYVSQFGWGRTLLNQLPSFDEVMRGVSASTFLTSVGGVFSSTVGAVGNFLITVLLAVYFAASPAFYIGGLVKLFPIATRRRVLEIVSATGSMLRWWLIGKAGSMLFIGVLTWIGLSILDVRLALTLGLLAGLLSFIPNFGPILSALPAILLAFVDSPQKALYTAGLYVIVQLIESNIVTPLIEKETVELPPALTIMFQLSLAVLVGGLGLVLATPLLAMVMVLVQMVYIEDVLGDRNTELNREALDEAREEAAAAEDTPDNRDL
ncbi:MAG: AI-2E family transporter [Pyrinomonadaceae bacterium]